MSNGDQTHIDTHLYRPPHPATASMQTPEAGALETWRPFEAWFFRGNVPCNVSIEEAFEAGRKYERSVIRPSLSRDGDMWCALYGENLQEGVAGFGKSPQEAVDAFNRARMRPLITALNRFTDPARGSGWRGSEMQGAGPDQFACEFCAATHQDCTLIPHAEDCPITQARAAIAKASGEAR